MKRLAFLVAGALATWPAVAGAQERRAAPSNDPNSTIAVEMRLGPYRPNVDSDPALRGTPYQDLFGGSRRFMIGLEVDWEALHIKHLGSFGLGGWIGYTKATGTAFVTKTGLPSDEGTGLWVMPFAALAVARFDVVARETFLPIVPYAKFGVGSSLWQATNGRGTAVADKDQTIGRGHTNGLIYAVGAMVMLDFLQPQTAKTFRVEQGVNHTYLFAEWTVTSFNGLGQSSALRVGDSTWNLGFAFEM
jgi:hypothetical protein